MEKRQLVIRKTGVLKTYFLTFLLFRVAIEIFSIDQIKSKVALFIFSTVENIAFIKKLNAANANDELVYIAALILFLSPVLLLILFLFTKGDMVVVKNTNMPKYVNFYRALFLIIPFSLLAIAYGYGFSEKTAVRMANINKELFFFLFFSRIFLVAYVLRSTCDLVIDFYILYRGVSKH